MSTTTLNLATASGSFIEALVKFFNSFVSTGKPAVVREPTWADGARFM